MPTFKPTHEITVTCGTDTTKTLVRLEDGVAYTREEWDQSANADWTVNDAGEWLCNGQATPGGAAGTVEVRPLAARGA